MLRCRERKAANLAGVGEKPEEKVFDAVARIERRGVEGFVDLGWREGSEKTAERMSRNCETRE